MARTDAEVVAVLHEIYAEIFGGKEGQRFLISWSDLRDLYGLQKLFQSRFDSLVEASASEGLYVLDLGEGPSGYLIAVIRSATVDRWRKVPKSIIKRYLPPANNGVGVEPEEDDD